MVTNLTKDVVFKHYEYFGHKSSLDLLTETWVSETWLVQVPLHGG
jgi:hypothetical protein